MAPDSNALMHHLQALMHDANLHHPVYELLMSDLNAAALAYVRFVCDQLDLSPTGLAKEVGISSTTLTRPLNSQDHKHSLSMTTVNKIAEYTGISFAPFAESKNIIQLNDGLINPKNYDPTKVQHGPLIQPDHIQIIGDVAVDVWRGIDAVAAMSRGTLAIRHAQYPTEQCFAVRCADDSMDRIAARFDILVCLRAEHWRGRLRRDDIAIVERKSDDGKRTELSARRVRETEDAWEFYSDSNNKEWDEVIPFLGNHADRHSQILGLAILIVRSVWGSFNDA